MRVCTGVATKKYSTLTIEPFAWSTLHYDEALHVLQEWRDLAELAQCTYDSLDVSVQPAFFQLVLYPVLAGGNVMELYILTHLGYLYKSQLRTSTNELAEKVRDAFTKDADLTDQYNGLLDGRWDHIIDSRHIGYAGRNPPPANRLPALAYVSDDPEINILGVAVQGQNASFTGEPLLLRPVDPYMPPSETRYIDIFTRANGTFSYKIQSNASYISLTNANGTVTAPGNPDTRAIITIDWTKAPHGKSMAAFTINSNHSTATANLPIYKYSIPSPYTGYIEPNKAISIEAAHHSVEPRHGISYTEIPYYGRTLSGVKIWPVTPPPLTPDTGPKLIYDFYATSSAEIARLTFLLGASLDHDPSRPLKLAYALDGKESRTTRVFAD
ncbi:hypothetical protein BDV25DRAFT_138173 [Aspergillus avenaceus]|uniref:Gylcosyl hydrolase 115 C-terminal domain-containing protein n=1 Tax=Aspergillus avenaceus TaxID=36643 RepID=A0A5N6U0H6_ASPAV|nr:hypothetical protein BDV25DRAFT_138173 [Aspergillus avenaceus]